LDRFKEVNDTFGHAAGDRTLEILSERLTRNLSKDAVIGRLAGDEFAMFIDDLPVDTDNARPWELWPGHCSMKSAGPSM